MTFSNRSGDGAGIDIRDGIERSLALLERMRSGEVRPVLDGPRAIISPAMYDEARALGVIDEDGSLVRIEEG